MTGGQETSMKEKLKRKHWKRLAKHLETRRKLKNTSTCCWKRVAVCVWQNGARPATAYWASSRPVKKGD